MAPRRLPQRSWLAACTAGAVLAVAAVVVLLTGVNRESATAPVTFLSNPLPAAQDSPAPSDSDRAATPSGAPIPRPTAPPVSVQESGIVVDSPDPPPFSPPAASGALAPRSPASPVEPVGALSGVNLGSWLELWPILLLVTLLGIVALAQVGVRRPAPPGD